MGIGEISVCEPNIKAIDGIELCGLDDLIMNSDILLLLVDHKEFRVLSSKCLDEKIIIDTRGFLKK